MTITKLTIFKSKRFAITGISKLVYVPKNLHQMILGANGSGKSSLVAELSFLPANLKKTYNQGGGKIIEGTHLHTQYKLQSGMSLKNKHSFLVRPMTSNSELDWKELNGGGTYKIQLALVEEHTGLTPFLHEVFTGQKNFTSFNVTERKKWFTIIDVLDYDYVYSKYNALRVRNRDLKSTMGTLLNREMDTDEPLPNHDRSELEEQLRINKDRVKSLDDFKISYGNNVIDLTVTDKLRASNSRLELIWDDELRETNLTEATDNLALSVELMNKSKTEIEVQTEKVEYIKEVLRTHSRSVATLEKDLSILNLKIDKMDTENVFNVPSAELYNSIGNITRVKGTLSEYFENLDEYKHIKPEEFTVFNNSYKQCVSASSALGNRINIVKNDIQHLQKHKGVDDIECPECKHTFGNNSTEAKERELNHEIQDLSKRLEYFRGKMKKYNEVELTYNKRKQIVKGIQHLLEDSAMKPFSFYLYEENEFNTTNNYQPLLDGIDRLIVKLNTYSPYLDLVSSRDSLANELEIHNRSLDVFKDVKFTEKHLDDTISNLKRLEEAHFTIVDKHRASSLLKSKLVIIQNEFDINKELRLRCKNLKLNITKNLEIETITLQTNIIQTKVNSLETEIIEDDKRIRVKETNDTLTKDLSRELAHTTELMSFLSPTTGVIGESINSFLDAYLGKVNHIISVMWSYKLEVCRCALTEDGALAYDFPVILPGDSEDLRDVREGSKSMKEIINLGFALAAMDYLGFEDYPIYLDEFGSEMDVTHRNKTFSLLREITKKHSNVFMISHYVEFYGGIANIDINVLTEENVDISKSIRYNQNLILER